jgi:hypothetical protein
MRLHKIRAAGFMIQKKAERESRHEWREIPSILGAGSSNSFSSSSFSAHVTTDCKPPNPNPCLRLRRPLEEGTWILDFMMMPNLGSPNGFTYRSNFLVLKEAVTSTAELGITEVVINWTSIGTTTVHGIWWLPLPTRTPNDKCENFQYIKIKFQREGSVQNFWLSSNQNQHDSKGQAICIESSDDPPSNTNMSQRVKGSVTLPKP